MKNASPKRRNLFSTPKIHQKLLEALESRTLLSTTYYVAATGGSDNNAGTSQTAPWASVTKVDNTVFQPGDQILFQRGGEWHGQLTASASGTAANPIVYADYGNSSLAKPTFDGSDIVPQGKFTYVSGNVYTFNVGDVPNSGGNAYWVYSNNAGMLAASATDTSAGSVFNNSNSFYINGTTVYINTGDVNPNTSGLYSLGDRAAGTNANSSLINSNAFSYITFQNIIGRETAEVGSGNSLTGGINDGYVFRIQGGSNISLLGDEADYGSKHNVGAIDTTAFIANGLLVQGCPEAVADNGLPYGNATATVAYSDAGQTGDTSQWINVTVQNYDGGQPAFLTHNDGSNSIASILLQNFISIGAPIAFEPGTNVAITYKGGEITDNNLTCYTSSGTTETIDGVQVLGTTSNSTGVDILVYGGATVQNCLVTNSGQDGGIQVSGANNTVRFNTIKMQSYATAINLESNSTGSKVYGNLITGTSNAIKTGSSTTYSADYDFIDSTNGTVHFYPNGATDTLAQFQAAGYETHAVVANPVFTNASSGDFSLQASSPAINTVPTTAMGGITGITTDIRGFTRPSANVYDNGAYEFQSTLHQPTIATSASANPNPVTGTTTALSVLGASQDGEATLTYTWSLTGTPPAPVTYSANGTNASKNTTATFTKAGTYNFLVTVSNGSYSTTSSIAVTVSQISQGIVITPTSALVAVNTTQQFAAIVADQFGNAITSASVSYSVSVGSGTIDQTGLYTAPTTTGSATVKATAGTYSATASVTITPPNQAPTVATAASASPNPVTGTTTTLSVLGADDNGESNLTYTWTTLGTPPAAVSFSANGTNAAKSTVATFTANGNYNFLVTIKDSGGLTVTSTTTVTVNTFVPIVLDGSLDGRYGSPAAVQTQVTNIGGDVYGSGAKAPFSQLSAAYGVIDEADNQFDLFIAGSLEINNEHLDLLIDSVSGAGVSNLSSISGVGPWGTAFPTIAFDNGTNGTGTFLPDHLFTFAYGGGYALDYANLDSLNNGVASDINGQMSADPASAVATSPSGVPYFQERLNNAADTGAVPVSQFTTLSTGLEYAFSLSGLGYTTAMYNAGTPIGVQAIISYGSHTEATNQILAPYTPNQSELNKDGGIYTYYGSGNFDFSNNTRFAGNQFFDISPSIGGNQTPTVAQAALATPNPVTGTSTALSVLGADDGGESNLTYTWSIQGTPPAPVTYSANGTNGAKNTTITFTKAGTYTFVVTITDAQNVSTTSSLNVVVNSAAASVSVPTTASSVIGGSTTQISATDQFGYAIPATSVTWSVNGGGTISPYGVFTAGQTGGTYTISATAGGVLKTASITVVPTVYSDASGSDTYGIRLAPGNSSVEQIFVNTPISGGTPTYTIAMSQLTNLSFTPTGDDGSLTIDYSNGNPLPSGGISYVGGAGMPPAGGNELYIKGNSAGSMTFSLNGSQVINQAASSSPISYSNIAGIEFDLAGGSNTLTQTGGTSPVVTFNAGSGNNTLNINGGIFTLAGNPEAGGGNVTVNDNAALVFAAGTSGSGINLRDLAALNIGAGATATLNSAVSQNDRMGVILNELAIDTTGTFNLGGNDLVVKNAAFSDIIAALTSGYAHGTWNGPAGILSSKAAGDSQHLTTLGYRTGGSAFDGINTTSSDILIKYTYVGDADLSGSVNGADYQQIDSGYGSSATGWMNGNFNYDNVVDGSDFSLIDNAFNQNLASNANPLAIVAGNAKPEIAKPAAAYVPAVNVFNDGASIDQTKVHNNAQDIFEG